MFWRRRELHPIARSIIEHPDDWTFTEYTADHKPSGMMVWTSNVPILNIHVWRPFSHRLSFVARLDIWLAIRHVKASKVKRLLSGER